MRGVGLVMIGVATTHNALLSCSVAIDISADCEHCFGL